MSAALEALGDRAPGAPLWAVGHSVGGQLIGLMDNHQRLQGVVTVGTSFGYWGYMPGLYRWFVFGMWYGAVPLLTRLNGYLPAQRLGLGEDLPAGVAREWARWGKRRDYFSQELAQEPGFQQLSVPWKAILLKDDKIATRRNAEPLYALYPRVALEVEELDPTAEGYGAIGHLGFFSRTRRSLWPRVTDFIQAHQGQAAPSKQRVS
jgi:predicted alpha/beta hydrolase